MNSRLHHEHATLTQAVTKFLIKSMAQFLLEQLVVAELIKNI